MNFRTVPAGHRKEPDDVDGVLNENVRRARHHSATFDPKIRRITQCAGCLGNQPSENAT